MEKSAKNSTPIYSSEHDDDYFKLVSISLEKSENGSLWESSKPISTAVIHELWEKGKKEKGVRIQEDYDFYLSCLILAAAERPQRRLLNRIAARTSRNIRLSTYTTRKYLKEVLEKLEAAKRYPYSKFPKMSMKEKIEKIREIVKVLPSELDGMVHAAFVTVKDKLGFPKVNPNAVSYKVDSEVIAAAKEEKCIKFLKQQQERKFVFPVEFERICDKLNEKYVFDAKNVIKALKKTKCRDHIAVLSISTERNNKTYVSMVNEESKFIKMESRQFLELIENDDTSLRLHTFEKIRMNTPAEPFEFNCNKAGLVAGKFNAEEAYIDVGCFNEDTEALIDRATYILDITYTLCVYTVLKRLDQDKERFNRLLDKAKTVMPIKDPFAMLNPPACVTVPSD